MAWKNIASAIPVRFITAALLALSCVVYALNRSNMSIIVLAMTKNPYNSSIEMPDYGPRYEWSTYEQSLVVGAYFWGNVVICLFAGMSVGRYGVRHIVGYAFGIVALLSALSPVSGQYLWLLIFIRFLSGIAMGTLPPAVHEIARKWAPPDERGLFLSVAQFSGLGVVLDWSMSGHIIEHYGWVWAFYVVAIMFAMFTVLWFLIFYDSPNEHPRITEKEKALIASKANPANDNKKRWPPLRSILTSVPFWGLMFLDVGNKYGYYFILTSVPRYLSEVHEFSIEATGLWASLPYVMKVPLTLFFGYIGDLLIRKKAMSTVAIRKWFSICSHFIPGCFLLGVVYVGHLPYVCLTFITLSSCFHSAIVITTASNNHDLAPNFAATLNGLTSLVGFTSGFLAPLVVAYFTRNQSTEAEWQNIFFVGAGIFILTNIIFLLFGSGSVQKWNNIEEDAPTSDEKNGINESTLDEKNQINGQQHAKSINSA